MSRLEVVSQDLNLDEYRELAEFRHQIRCFLSATEQNATSLGVDAETYAVLLAVQGLPEGARPTVPQLAQRLCMTPEHVSDLIDRAAAHGDMTRSSSEGSPGEDWVKMTRTGRELLRRMALANREELERNGPELVRALQTVLKQRRRRHRGVA